MIDCSYQELYALLDDPDGYLVMLNVCLENNWADIMEVTCLAREYNSHSMVSRQYASVSGVRAWSRAHVSGERSIN